MDIFPWVFLIDRPFFFKPTNVSVCNATAQLRLFFYLKFRCTARNLGATRYKSDDFSNQTPTPNVN